MGCALAEFDQSGNWVDLLREEDKENKLPLNSAKKPLTILYASEPEQLHRAIKKGILTYNAHKKASTETMENLLFRFTIRIKGEVSGQEGVFNLVELSSNGLVHFDRSRVKKGAEGLRKLESVYQSAVIKTLSQLLQPTPQMAFIYILNINQLNEQSEQLLTFSQLVQEKSDTDRLSKNLRLIVGKKVTAKKPSLSSRPEEPKKSLR